MTDLRSELLDLLDRLNGLVRGRDLRVLEEFAPHDDTLLVGSELGEVARGPGEMEAFFRAFFALPYTAGWVWRAVDIAGLGDVAWLFAEGDVIVIGADGEQRMPYRLAGVLERRDGRWTWRLFHGSEPAKAPE